MFEPLQKTASPKILVKIGVSHAAGRKSESDYLNYIISFYCDPTPAVNSRLQQARYELKVVEASA
jgi:hypothetical protein